MFKHGDDLIPGDAGKPFQELIDSRSGLEIFKQRSHWNAGAPKNPSAMKFIFRTLDFRTICPIQHLRK